MTGYIGTDTMPSCDAGFCWYFIEKVFEISEDQLNYLKDKNTPSNARAVDLGIKPTNIFNAAPLFSS